MGKALERADCGQVSVDVLSLFKQHYADYGPTLANEKLHQCHQIEVHPETLRSWLRQARLSYKQHKARPHQALVAAAELLWRDGSMRPIKTSLGPRPSKQS